MKLSKPFRHKGIAFITGASSGLGAEFARQLANDGYHLILTARRGHRLKELREELMGRHGCRVLTVTADLSQADGVEKLLRFFDQRDLTPSLFVNNAGFGFHGRIVDNDSESTRAMVHVNVVAATLLARAMAARMLVRGRGGIINLSSLAAFQPCPYTGVYGATKAYLYMFSESLRAELRDTPIRVLTLCPGMTRTEFHLNAGPPYRMQQQALFAEAKDVVHTCLEAYNHGRSIVVPGGKNRLLLHMQRFLPRAVISRLAAWVLAPVGQQ